MFLCLYMAFYYGKKKTLIILKQHILECQLNMANIWQDRNIVIRKIQHQKLSAYLSSQSNNNIEKKMMQSDL